MRRVLMIKSKSWEISAWNPKDSAIFKVLSGEKKMEMRGRKRAGEKNLSECGSIYPMEVAHRDLLWSLREPSTPVKTGARCISRKKYRHVIAER